MADDDPWLALVRSSLSHEASYELLRTRGPADRAADRGHDPSDEGLLDLQALTWASLHQIAKKRPTRSHVL